MTRHFLSLSLLGAFVAIGFITPSYAANCVSHNGKPMISIEAPPKKGKPGKRGPLNDQGDAYIDPQKCGLAPVNAPLPIDPQPVPVAPPVAPQPIRGEIIDLPIAPPVMPAEDQDFLPRPFDLCSMMRLIGLNLC